LLTSPTKPGLHVHAANDLLAVGEVAFAGQAAHETSPEIEALTYDPGGQKEHAFARCACLTSSSDASSTLQFVHGPLPGTVLYVPAAQATHAPAAPENPALHAQVALALGDCEFNGHFTHCAYPESDL
jgi:hypothetical protein